MAHRIYHDEEILRLDFDQTVTNDELGEIARTLAQLESSFPIVPHRLTDLTGTKGVSSTFAEILELAKARKALKFANSFKSAIVAPRPVHVGIARMFSTLNDHPQITIRIFPDVESARAWLDET